MTRHIQVQIQTERLKLVLQSPAEVRAGIERMEAHERAQVSPEWLARVEALTISDPWIHGFKVVNRESGVTVGTAGFKGPPDPGGIVEIAYGIALDHQGRDCAP